MKVKYINIAAGHTTSELVGCSIEVPAPFADFLSLTKPALAV